MKTIDVQQCVVDWPSQRLEIRDYSGTIVYLPLDRKIVVTMVGFFEPEEMTLNGGELASYMLAGFSIRKIQYEG